MFGAEVVHLEQRWRDGGETAVAELADRRPA
jgi:hypothetical protein